MQHRDHLDDFEGLGVSNKDLVHIRVSVNYSYSTKPFRNIVTCNEEQ